MENGSRNYVHIHARRICSMEAMGCDTAEKLKSEIPKLRSNINPRVYKDFYNFCFMFAKGDTVWTEMAIGMWNLLLTDKFKNLPLLVNSLKIVRRNGPYLRIRGHYC